MPPRKITARHISKLRGVSTPTETSQRVMRIMHKMKLRDILSVVAFSDRAEEIILASHNTELSQLESRNPMLPPSGGRGIFSGLEMGYNLSNDVIMVT